MAQGHAQDPQELAPHGAEMSPPVAPAHPGPAPGPPTAAPPVGSRPPGGTESAGAAATAHPVRGLILLAVLALAFGGLGAYAERRFVEQPTADAKPATPGEPDQPGGPAPENAGPSAKDLSDRIAKVSERVDALTHQVANLPKPAPPPDLSDVQVKLADLGNQAEKVAPLEAAIKKIDARLVEIGQSVASLGDELHAHKARGGASRGPDPNLIPSPAPERPVAEEALEQGADLFQKKKYQDALDLFSKLEQTNPDDARVWYYAALAHGFAKKQWTDGTSRLVEKGIERERAGTPSGPVIDRTFKDLTSATGKEWLATYRKRVKDQ